MGRAAGPEAIRAGEEVLLVDRLQHHRYSALRHLVFEGRDAERPLRAVRFRDVGPAHRRCVIAARANAIQEVRQIGLEVRFVVRRRHAVDARGTILARQPIGLLHPVQIDDVVQRAESYPRFRPRQFGYPLPVRGQVCRAQGPLPCFASTVLYSWRFPSLGRVPLSAVPRRCRYYGGATTSRPRIPGHLFASLPGPTRFLAMRARCSSAPVRWRSRSGPGSLFSRRSLLSGYSSCGREWELSGSQATHPAPLPDSTTPAEPAVPRQWRSRQCCPCPPEGKGFSVI
jgi:hypothetical protein